MKRECDPILQLKMKEPEEGGMLNRRQVAECLNAGWNEYLKRRINLRLDDPHNLPTTERMQRNMEI